jgi:hypothetical protein
MFGWSNHTRCVECANALQGVLVAFPEFQTSVLMELYLDYQDDGALQHPFGPTANNTCL